MSLNNLSGVLIMNRETTITELVTSKTKQVRPKAVVKHLSGYSEEIKVPHSEQPDKTTVYRVGNK
jgi:hypothetical protein